MRFRFATRSTASAIEPADVVLPEPNPLHEGTLVKPAEQAAYVRHLFGVDDPVAFRAFTLLDPDRMRDTLLQFEMDHRAQSERRAALVDEAGIVAGRLAKGQAMIEQASDHHRGRGMVRFSPPDEWLALLAELEAEAVRLAAAITHADADLDRLNRLYPAALSWYTVHIGGEPLEEYAQEKMP